MAPPQRLILDLSQELGAFVRELKALKLAGDDELDSLIGRHVSDVFSHLYDKRTASSYIDAYTSDCIEVFANSVGDNLDGPEADFAYRYGCALTRFGIGAFESLVRLGAYGQDDLLHYSFSNFLGQDVVMEHLTPLNEMKNEIRLAGGVLVALTKT